MAALAQHAETLRGLHVPGRPIVLPNAWDVASAQLVAASGFPAVATSSSALNATLGFDDDGSAAPDQVFAAIGRIAAAVSVPLTADIEAGYGLASDALVDALLTAGAAGCNLEDSDRGGLVAAETQAQRIAEVKAAGRGRGVDLVLNARIDVFLRGDRDLDEAIRRARIYLEAGADCVYPILMDGALVARFVAEAGGPVNVLAALGEPLDALASLGVARISFGGRVAEAASSAVRDILDAISRRPA